LVSRALTTKFSLEAWRSNREPTVKLAIIRQRYTPFGGAERAIENALAALREQLNLEVTVIAREWSAHKQDYSVLICNPFHIGRFWRLWAFSRAVCRKVFEDKFNLVQSHERLSCCDIFRAGDGVHREWLLQRKRILPRWRQWMLSFSPFHRLLLWQERRMFASRRLQVVIANSELVRADILRHYPTTKARIEVIYNGVDLDRFHPRSRDEFRASMRQDRNMDVNTFVLLFIGSGFERKGLATAIRALAELPRNVLLVVVGKDRKQPDYLRLAQSLGIGSRVRFDGPQLDVLPYYAMADLLILPSLYDPFPNVVLEAMACGLPVIASKTSGFSDFYPNEVLDALDVDAWTSAVISAMESENLVTMGKKSRMTAERFSISKMTQSLLSIYVAQVSSHRHQKIQQSLSR
jgi:UDP-glucose:(heptosyl)LPS alpha-1,3-glucosyltransferase